ncbi:MAG TPA: glutamate-1-semialdehyde 2,1-aminomutase [Terriglobales bacterium]|nr:glutamate-1-semialdehyde 2,1-aminomutase [Terriglobia bacterium]HZU41435.1 glutamate-1-semialdehyde 2,1-aminomutase [Terriglobales bacterium]
MIRNRITEQSQKIFEAKRRYTPGGINSFTRSTQPPLIFTRAQGAYLYDADGNRYIDYHAAFGPTILGHCHPAVQQAVIEAMARIDLVGIGTTELELDLAAKIAEHVPSAEMVQLCNTGTEATYNAVRLARAVTGRKKLLKFQGCFHGSHDYLCMNIISPAERLGKIDPGSAGMLPESLAHTLVAEFNNLAEVESVLEREGENIAAIILEPIAHNIGCVVARQDFLEGLRRIADARGIILIFDEVITGFRHDLGGYQALCGVTPDLTTLGKSMANGFPCAALCGKRRLMERFSTAGGDVIFAGTYNGNPTGTAAALATIAQLENPAVYKHIFGLGEEMRQAVRDIIAELGIQAFVAGFGSVFVIYFMDPPANSYTDLLRNNSEMDKRFRQQLIESGIIVNPFPLKRGHISASHTEADIAETLEAIRASLAKTQQGAARA